MDISLSKREIELARLGRDFFEQVLAPLEILTDEHGERWQEHPDSTGPTCARAICA